MIRIINTGVIGIYRDNAKEQETLKKRRKIYLTGFHEKRGRGRPSTIHASEVLGRSQDFRLSLSQVWDRLWPLLSKATTEAEVVQAFEDGANPYHEKYVPSLAGLILQILREATFPNRRKSQINFLAESLAGLGIVSPRRSRDICAEERAKEERAHRIIRYEYYVECSCGYQGHSRDHGCPKCGTKIEFGYETIC